MDGGTFRSCAVLDSLAELEVSYFFVGWMYFLHQNPWLCCVKGAKVLEHYLSDDHCRAVDDPAAII